MSKKSANRSPSKGLRRSHLFGPPPILEGESAKDYYELFDHVFEALAPSDFIQEIWVRDVTDAAWSMFRWRRILAALLAEDVSEETNDEAASLAEDQTELMEGPEKEEMDKLLDSNSQHSWEVRVAKYPRANKKFQELWSSAKSTLNMDLIQAKVMRENFNLIERIEALIATAQQRIDEVIRELDRHRIIQEQLKNFEATKSLAASKTAHPKMIEGQITNKKVA
jgi:hypothetical protein